MADTAERQGQAAGTRQLPGARLPLGSPRSRHHAAVITSTCLHVVAFALFAIQQDLLGLPADWPRDFLVLLVLSLLLIFATHFSRSYRMRLAAAIFRIVVFMIIGLPFGRFLEIRYVLLVSLLLDVTASFDPPGDLVLSTVVLSSSAVFFIPLRIYSRAGTPPDAGGILSFAIVGIVTAEMLVILRRMADRYGEATRRVDGLEGVVSGLVGASHAYLDYAAKVERRSTEQERTRITQELHDIVGQAFTNISAMMEASLKHPPAGAEELSELHTWVKDQAHHGLAETRAILYELRSIREPELSGIQAINNLVATFERSTRVKVKVEWGNLPWQLGPVLDGVLYKLVQESLINAFRHGHATEITVHFWVDDRSLLVDVNDNGKGGSPGKKGIGQEGMEQRATAVGGTVSFAGSTHGYRVHAEFPRRLLEGT